MEAKILNTTKLNVLDIIKGNFLAHRFLSLFYSAMFVFFVWYTYVNFELLLQNLQALIMGVALLILSAWVGFIWPILKGFIWYIKLKVKKGTSEQILNIQFYDLYLKIDNETLGSYYKLEYKDIYKVIDTKKLLIFLFYKNFVYIKKDGFKKANDLNKVKGYLKRQGLVK